MDYVELNVRVTDPELAEILTAELAELPYESFQTEGEVLKAYIPRERLADCMQQTDDLLARYGIADRRYIAIESQNWNALWEQNFTPVDVDGRILIRAPFHASQPGYELEVVVMPRMAFGSQFTLCVSIRAVIASACSGVRAFVSYPVMNDPSRSHLMTGVWPCSCPVIMSSGCAMQMMSMIGI